MDVRVDVSGITRERDSRTILGDSRQKEIVEEEKQTKKKDWYRKGNRRRKTN